MSSLLATHTNGNRFTYENGEEWIIYPEFFGEDNDLRIYTENLKENKAFFHYICNDENTETCYGYTCEFLEGSKCHTHDTNPRHGK